MGYKPKTRWIKPQFFMSEQVASVSPAARLCFIGLWSLADREGRLEDKPAQIKVHLFPYDAKLNVDTLLTELHQSELITRYEAEGVQVIEVCTFTEHQSVHPNEAQSKLPCNVIKLQVITSNYTERNDKGTLPNSNSIYNSNNRSNSNSNKSNNRAKIDTNENKKKVIEIPDDGIPYKEIISDLNSVTKKEYPPTTPKTQELIRARWNEGNRLDDFKYVHRVKVEEWLDDSKWDKYLRPKTLYGTNFDGYRNQKMKGDISSSKDGMSPKLRRELQNLKDAAESFEG